MYNNIVMVKKSMAIQKLHAQSNMVLDHKHGDATLKLPAAPAIAVHSAATKSRRHQKHIILYRFISVIWISEVPWFPGLFKYFRAKGAVLFWQAWRLLMYGFQTNRYQAWQVITMTPLKRSGPYLWSRISASAFSGYFFPKERLAPPWRRLAIYQK